MVAMDMVNPFWRQCTTFDVSGLLANEEKLCLLLVRPLPRSRARGGSQDEEKLLLYDIALNTGGGRAVVHSVSDC